MTPTPPPGQAFGTRLPWDETSRPRYPVPAAASYTEAQQAHPQHLIDIHDALRAELTQLRDVVDQVRRGLLQVGQARSVINTMTMRQNNWTLGAYCESYCRIVTGHHTLEDRSMFAFLRQRDPDAAPVVDRLAEEHEVIADVLEQVDRALVGARRRRAPRRPSERLEQLSTAVDLLSDTLLSHLSYEERELLHPLATSGLTADAAAPRSGREGDLGRSKETPGPTVVTVQPHARSGRSRLRGTPHAHRGGRAPR